MIRAHAHPSFRPLLAVVACIALVSLGSGTAAGAPAPSPSPQTSGHYGSLSELSDSGVTPMASSGVITAGSCKYQQRTDDPHDPYPYTYVSVHGWWTKYSGTCPSKANVDPALQAVYCDSFGCYWKTVATGSVDYYQGGGSGQRSTGKEFCSRHQTVGWRGRVDVDLIGWSDPSGCTYTSGHDFPCYPSS